jgi:hypothetical protein
MDIIAAMTIYSESNWSGKVRFIYNLFDFDDSGGITMDEMAIMGGCFTRGICIFT